MTHAAETESYTRTGSPLQHLALALGVHGARAADGAPASLCAVCGPSPFPVADRAHKVLGAGWSDWMAMYQRGGADICTGCARLMSGRPGDDPPPVRFRSFAVRHGVHAVLDRSEMYHLLCEPPVSLELLSWATTGQKHHWLHVGWCTPDRLVVGSDDGPITIDTLAVAPMIAAVADLRSGPLAGQKPKARVTRDEILSGAYRPATIAAVGAQRWAVAEQAIAPWRGSPVLRLYVEHTPVRDDPSSSELPMVDPHDQQIANVLATLAQQSAYRERDPIAFWSHVFLRRIRRHAHRPLPQFLARLMADLEVTPTGDAAQCVHNTLTALDADDQREFMARIADRAPVLTALAYEERKQRAAAKPKRSAKATEPDTEETLV